MKKDQSKKEVRRTRTGLVSDDGGAALSERIAAIWSAAQAHAARTVSVGHVCGYWLTGREIVEDEQQGESRAAYGKQVLAGISERLAEMGAKHWSFRNLAHARAFFLGYPELLDAKKVNAVRSQLGFVARGSKVNAVRSKSAKTRPDDVPIALRAALVPKAGSGWKPGMLHANLSWSHYRALIRVKRRDARDFYEIEAIKNGWSGRQLERQIVSLLFERLAKSRDKAGVLVLANQGLIPERPVDVIKDPYVLEFLELPASHRLVESSLEAALISQMQAFLLELGSGFAFIGRQKRLTLDGDHFYPDLVFYHVVLKCYVIIDLKVGKLNHADLGQMQLYVHYYDREVAGPGDQPTLGLILCTDKNDAVVRYILPESNQQIFASRYQLHLPSEAQLREEMQREIEILAAEKDLP